MTAYTVLFAEGDARPTTILAETSTPEEAARWVRETFPGAEVLRVMAVGCPG